MSHGNFKLKNSIATLLISLILMPTAQALEVGSGIRSTDTSLSIGLEFESGDYGTADTTDTWRIPFEFTYQDETFFTGMSISYINAKSSGNVVVSGGHGGRMGTTTTTSSSSSVSGLGDLSVYAGYRFKVNESAQYNVLANIKLATADETEGLGTGESDYALEVGMRTRVDEVYYTASLGYQLTGDSSTTNYSNIVYSSLGLTFLGEAKRQYGVMLDYSQSTTQGFDDALELTGFFDMPIMSNRYLYSYVLLGLSDGSPDYGAGLSLRTAF